MQSIGDYENWRDSLQDRPIPDDTEPDLRMVRFYSHEDAADTKLEYTLTGNQAELRLSFYSDDPDLGTEELSFARSHGEDLYALASELRGEITAWLDAQDTSSFQKQQGIESPEWIHSLGNDYGGFTRSSLYAFEGILRETEQTQQKLKELQAAEKPQPVKTKKKKHEMER